MQLRNKHLLAGTVPALAVLLACVVALVACGQQEGARGSSDGSASSLGQAQASSGIIESVADDDPYGTGVHHATIEVEGYGTIEVALNANGRPSRSQTSAALPTRASTTA